MPTVAYRMSATINDQRNVRFRSRTRVGVGCPYLWPSMSFAARNVSFYTVVRSFGSRGTALASTLVCASDGLFVINSLTPRRRQLEDASGL